MAKRQTRRSISVSRSTYERLRAYCETNGISMSQFVETRVGDFLGRSIRRPGAPNFTGSIGPSEERLSEVVAPTPVLPRPPVVVSSAPPPAPVVPAVAQAPAPRPTPPRPAQAAPPPAKLTPDQIFTF